MKNLKSLLVAAISLFAVTACSLGSIKEDCASCVTKVDTKQPAVVYLSLNANKDVTPVPESILAYPGQEIVYFAQENFVIYYIGRTPNDPKSQKTFFKYESKRTAGGEYKLTLPVSPQYKGFGVLESQDKITSEMLSKLLGKKIEPNSGSRDQDKSPVDRKDTLEVNYLIEIGGRLFDPSARIVKN